MWEAGAESQPLTKKDVERGVIAHSPTLCFFCLSVFPLVISLHFLFDAIRDITKITSLSPYNICYTNTELHLFVCFFLRAVMD